MLSDEETAVLALIRHFDSASCRKLVGSLKDAQAEIDRLFNSAESEVSQEKRKQFYLRWQQIVAEQVPIHYFSYPKTQPAVRNTLGNVTPIGLQGSIGPIDTMFYKQVLR